ncbi:MBL fold metallo-hydrolase [Undibacterium sp. TJN19]|uniref:MBL fold metallo-hydrolase n=1 Tax=Undibacterium sp. TJN19 TaxID=3413055 RepID=UPI003BF3E160
MFPTYCFQRICKHLLPLAVLACVTVFAQASTTKGYTLKEIRGGVYFLSDGAYNTIFIVADQGVIVVDPLPTLGKKYLQAIAEVTPLPVVYIIYSHEHLDHIGAATLFPASAKIIAQTETRRALEKANDARRPLPDISFDQSYRLQLGNQEVLLEYAGSNHTAGNIVIHLPRQKILMLVDVIYPGHAPYPNLGVASDISGTLAVNRAALNYDFTDFVGGHVGQTGERKDVQTSLEFLNAVESTARQVLTEKTFPDYLRQTPNALANGTWFAHDDYEKERVDACYARLLPGWETRLLGLARSLKSHCWAMIVSLAIAMPPEK